MRAAVGVVDTRSSGAQHAAVTDVSSGYKVLSLAGPPVRDVLAQGCPLDLHPRVFTQGSSACTHWFKASVTLWPSEAQPGFELLVRRSFMGYAWQMLERTTVECELLAVRCDGTSLPAIDSPSRPWSVCQ